MLMAGLDGIQNRIYPGEPIDQDLYELTRNKPDQFHRVSFIRSSH